LARPGSPRRSERLRHAWSARTRFQHERIYASCFATRRPPAAVVALALGAIENALLDVKA